MTDKILNDYYLKHKDMYCALGKCTSVSEVLLKICIYGSRWSQWDWMLFFTCAIADKDLPMPDSSRCANASTALYEDMLCTIDTTSMLDSVMTRKNVLLSFIYGVNSCRSLRVQYAKEKLLVILAHVFKKFPKLWTMSWMFAKFKDSSEHGSWKKYHRLASSAPIEGICSTQSNAMLFYREFIKLHFKERWKDEE